MALDPPITQAEEEIVALMRVLSEKQVQMQEARAQADVQVEAEREAQGIAHNVREQIVDRLHEQGINNPDAILRGRDLERPTWKAEVWDRQSPINGVPADQVLVHHPEAQDDGDVAIVRDASGAVVMFQPYEPGQPGITPIPKGQGAQRGAALADDIVASVVSSELLQRVMERLTPATT